MVGIEVLSQLLEDDRFKKVVSIARGALDIESLKLVQIRHENFLNYEAIESILLEADICFYCIGVYQPRVSKGEFWEVTVDYIKALVSKVRLVNKNLAFCLFSAQGASTEEKSMFQFGNAKGRAENYLLQSDIKKIYIFRPGFISPGQKRSIGGLALKFYQAISLLSR